MKRLRNSSRLQVEQITMKRYLKNKTIASITKSIGRNIKSRRRSKDKKLQ